MTDDATGNTLNATRATADYEWRPERGLSRDDFFSGSAFSSSTGLFALEALDAAGSVHHRRRRSLHFKVTKHPTTEWVVQQLREAFPFDSALGF